MNNATIPKLGLGTLYNTTPRECVDAVVMALDHGYRHLDTAQMYGNEAYVGTGIAESDVPREEIFLSTKIHQDNLAYDDVLSTTDDSLDRIGVDSIDLLYVHWPTEAYEPEETISAFNKLQEDGKIQHIGVSNFTPELLTEVREFSNRPIIANQVEMHPLLHQDELLGFCQCNDIQLVAYSPLAKGEVFDITVLNDIAEKHGVNEAQVSLAWLLSKENVAVIPKARGEHIQQNYEALSLTLDTEDIQEIDSIEQEKRFVDPPFRP